jgi:hypothetical protein
MPASILVAAAAEERALRADFGRPEDYGNIRKAWGMTNEKT